MKLLGLFTLLFFTLNSYSQTDSTKTGITNICQSIDSKKDTVSVTFYEGDTLRAGEAGYRNIFYSYRTEIKSKAILYIMFGATPKRTTGVMSFIFKMGI